jgi:hypothetical protein
VTKESKTKKEEELEVKKTGINKVRNIKRNNWA